ncbi:cilia- and flagella-associated protein 263 isoform X1 [Tiliqua scincoides]|uniref:cilia- and flagella-associated protein 263 isoform X1 n=1 Tax=Tiliqua scincoides TaxID=71010 RepID=UPI0034625C4E
MGDEESERDSVRTGESREPPEEQQLHDLGRLELPELRGLVHENLQINALLKLETDMFEKFFNRMEPRDVAAEKHGSLLDVGQVQYPRGRRRSKSRITTDHLIFLTVEQKCDLAQRELDETREDMQRMKENSDRLLHNYLAVLEEADIRIADIKKAMVDFDKDIVRTITKKKGSVIASEKVLKYMDDKIHTRDVIKEKMRLKNDSLKVQKKKMQMQLKQKEELGEALHEVDFQQLKIENAQFLEKIDERNQELLQLKLTVGSALQILNFYKKKLQNATAMASHLVKEIAQRFDSLEKIKWEGLTVEEEQSIAKHLNRKLRKQLAMYRVPPVLSYVHKKMTVYELENTIKIWERKVEIAEMALKSYRNLWYKAKLTSHQLQTLLPEQVTH